MSQNVPLFRGFLTLSRFPAALHNRNFPLADNWMYGDSS